MERMAAEAEAQIEGFSQQNLANLAWAFGKLSHYRRPLMDAIAEQAAKKVKVVFQLKQTLSLAHSCCTTLLRWHQILQISIDIAVTSDLHSLTQLFRDKLQHHCRDQN